MPNEVVSYDINGNEISYLVQWDNDVFIYIQENEIDRAFPMHFYNTESESAYVVETTFEDGKLKAKVPNVLLRQPYRIYGYVYMSLDSGQRSVYRITINIKPRPQPSDLAEIGTPDVISITSILDECKQYAKEAGDSATAAKASASSAEEAATRAEEAATRAEEAIDSIPESGGNVDLTGVVKSVNGKTPDENGNVEITVSSSETVDGGYYTPSVSQLNANTMSISFTASKEGMPVVSEKNITLPAGKNGDTPVRGTDYWTDDDIATIKSYVDEAILGGAW